MVCEFCHTQGCKGGHVCGAFLGYCTREPNHEGKCDAETPPTAADVASRLEKLIIGHGSVSLDHEAVRVIVSALRNPASVCDSVAKELKSIGLHHEAVVAEGCARRIRAGGL